MKTASCILAIVAVAACGTYKTRSGDSDTEDGTDDTSTGDTVVDTTEDGVEDGVVDVPVDVVPDTDDDCPPVPPGCIDYCADADGAEAADIGVQIRRCTVETDEHGCPYLDWTTEDCRPGTFRLSQVAVPMVHVWITPHRCGPFAALEGDGAGRIKPGEERLCDHAHGARD